MATKRSPPVPGSEAQLSEQPGETVARLTEEGCWPDPAKDFFNESLRRLTAEGHGPGAFNEAWREVQRRWPSERRKKELAGSTKGSLVMLEKGVELAKQRAESEPPPAPSPPAATSDGGRFNQAGRTPGDAEPPPLTDAERDRFFELSAGLGPNQMLTTPAEDVLWAYRNLDDRRMTAAQAPSPGAWSMLWYARAYRTKFFEKHVVDAVKTVSRQEEIKEEDVRALSDLDRGATGKIQAMLADAIAESDEYAVDEEGSLVGPYA